MADLSAVRRHLEQIAKLARMAAPSANASPNEQEIAARNIERAAESALVALGAPAQAPPPRSGPPPPRSAAPSPLAVEWEDIVGTPVPADGFRSLARFARSMTREQIVAAMNIAADRVDEGRVEPEAAFRYFCGICWRTIRGDA